MAPVRRSRSNSKTATTPEKEGSAEQPGAVAVEDTVVEPEAESSKRKRQRRSGESTSVLEKVKNPGVAAKADNEPLADEVSMEKSSADSGEPEAKPPKKKRRSSASVAKKEDTTEIDADANSRPMSEYHIQLLANAKMDAKKEFEEGRDAILARVPEEYKQMFHQVAFAKWKKELLPCVILSPYDISTSDVRKSWIKMFHNCEKAGRLEHLSFLVYWYGAKSSSEFYSFMAKSTLHLSATQREYQKGVTEYENALKKVKTCEQAGKKVPVSVQEKAQKYNEMLQDMLKPPEERRGVETTVVEGYDLLTMSDVEETGALGSEMQENADYDEEEEDSSSKRKKGKSFKKGGEKLKTAKAEQSVGGKARQGAKPSVVGSVGDIDAIGYADDGSDDDDEAKPIGKTSKASAAEGKKKTKHSAAGDEKVPKQEKVDTVDVIDNFGDKDDDSEDDERDDDFKKDIESEKDDEDFEEPTKQRRKASKKGAKVVKEKDAPAKKRIEKKHKVALSADNQKKKELEKTQKEYNQCKKKHGETLKEWDHALEDEDVSKVTGILKKWSEVVETLPACFISHSELPRLMKASKKVLQRKGGTQEDLAVCKKLAERMQATYEKGKDKIAATFVENIKKKKQEKEKAVATKKREDSMDAKTETTVFQVKASAATKPSELAVDELATSQSAGANNPAPTRVSDPIPKREITGISESKSRVTKSETKAVGPAKPSKPPKREKKKFNLGSFMRPRDVTASQETTGSGKTSFSGKRSKAAPSWVTEPCFVVAPTNEDRALALDFLRDLATHLPAGKVDVESVALQLEAAIHKWALDKSEKTDEPQKSTDKAEESNKPGDWRDDYWEKVHLLVAAIVGKRDPGGLISYVMDGYFSSPADLLLLAEDKLADSFEGRPVFLAPR